MKSLLIATIIGLAAVAQAKNTKFENQQDFNRLTAAQAMASAKYEKHIQTIHMPGSSTWSNPAYGLCTDGKIVKTTAPVTTCVQWSSTKDGQTKKFNFKTDADAYGNNVQCSATTSKILSSTIGYSQEECVLWGVQTKNAGGVKTFKSLGLAKNFADNSDDAASNATATCMDSVLVAKTIPTTYTVEFFLDDESLGKHSYNMSTCK